ncbi:MAG: hypothetical protein AAF183_17425 [Pseudomonadota bacterium]
MRAQLAFFLVLALAACQSAPSERSPAEANRIIEQAATDFAQFCLSTYPDAEAARDAMVASVPRTSSPSRELLASNRKGVIVLDAAGVGARLVIEAGAPHICGVQAETVPVEAFHARMRALMESDPTYAINFNRRASDRTWWRVEGVDRPTMFVLTGTVSDDAAGVFLADPDAK